jgi:DNA-binding winged helix-turn-helix (wHTH) protein
MADLAHPWRSERETHRRPPDRHECGRYIHLGPIRVDLQNEQVTNDGSQIKLSARSYKTFLVLLERPGQVVRRDTIRECLWPSRTCIDYDANINTTVNKLRRALGDSLLEQLFIETVHGKGYALVGHPTVSDRPDKLVALNTVIPRPPLGNLPDSICHLAARSTFWFVICVVGLILAGMRFGIALSAFWASHQR